MLSKSLVDYDNCGSIAVLIFFVETYFYGSTQVPTIVIIIIIIIVMNIISTSRNRIIPRGYSTLLTFV